MEINIIVILFIFVLGPGEVKGLVQNPQQVGAEPGHRAGVLARVVLRTRSLSSQSSMIVSLAYM